MDTEIIAMVMAGGKGERLFPLTAERAKPAVPFAGSYRLIDFVLSNLVNSGVNAIYVLTQYKAQSLISHLQVAWIFAHPSHKSFVTVVPAQMRVGEWWYRGTADSIYQNMNLINDHNAKYVLVFAADHVYRMDVRKMVEFHRDTKADVTVAGVPVSPEMYPQVGVMATDSDGRITAFYEKPKTAIPVPPDQCFGSMGNYIFTASFLKEILTDDATNNTEHDFGKSILPSLVGKANLRLFDFRKNTIPGLRSCEEPHYWRDVGSIASFFDAHMEVISANPKFNLHNPQWPIVSANSHEPPTWVDSGTAWARVKNSLISSGCNLGECEIENSVLGKRVKVGKGCRIISAIIMDNSVVEDGTVLNRCILDKGVYVARGLEISSSAAPSNAYLDAASQVVVLSKNSRIQPAAT